ncbi:hypothetical protein B5E84_18035 [Lachnoclostridium sp. An14]|uniref:HK97 gp10 family phage protein n=1 Tax=Lachnoclostridium sp. An14 TaxID=1965562 RepID=UPI000B36621B|nr:HK97 gp10 family phage protein [Lachnoclostridium sp. An14]OUQ13024.1 hypothetical protein B5E84_18035 [Lachnoclostridium sp. An14]
MSSFGSQMRKRFAELNKAGKDVPKIMAEVAEAATIAAVQVAAQNTPPNGSAIAGTNTRSGQMAQHWELDSQTKPVMTGGSAQTVLANNKQYASYVNDGHRVDKHYVPGLINNGGLLERVDPDVGGIMVGTKTTYVPGLYMKEKAIGKYRSVVRKELDRRVRERMK